MTEQYPAFKEEETTKDFNIPEWGLEEIYVEPSNNIRSEYTANKELVKGS